MDSGIVAMMRTARYVGLILMGYVLAYRMDYACAFIQRADFDKALVACAKNPTADNQAGL